VLALNAKPGETTKAQLTVRAAVALAVSVQAQGLGQTTDGNMSAVPPDKDTSTFSARSMVTATPTSLQMQPGDKATIDVTVVLPAEAGDGTRYAILTITGMPPGPTGSANVGFGVELGVSAVVTIAGTPQNKTGSIQAINVGKSLPGEALPVDVAFLNTGNTHYGAIPDELVATAVLQDASGTDLADATANGNQISVLPSFVRDLNLAMTPKAALVDGATYHLEAGVGLKDGSILDRKAIDFTWSGGEILGPTSAPIQLPPTAAPAATDPAVIVLAAALGAAAVAVVFLVASRLRRRQPPERGKPSS
jgi:hypothetical protein